jgi:hypothetical protein
MASTCRYVADAVHLPLAINSGGTGLQHHISGPQRRGSELMSQRSDATLMRRYFPIALSLLNWPGMGIEPVVYHSRFRRVWARREVALP